MSINHFRSSLYALARLLGDVQAMNKAARTGSPKPILRRIERRAAGRLTGRLLGRLFR